MRKVQIVEHEVVSRLPLESSSAQDRTRRHKLAIIGRKGRSIKLDLISDTGVLQEAGHGHSPWQNLACSAEWTPLAWFRLDCRGNFSGPRVTVPTAQPFATRGLDRSAISKQATTDVRLQFVCHFTSGNPALAAQIANGVAETYLDDQVLTKSGRQ